ncbi:hypothetical protein ACTFIZ_004218 [Dictyostelium cf. discoideum]
MRLAQTSNNTNHVNNDIDFLLSAFNSISLGESVGTKKNIQSNESDIAAIKEYLPSILQCQITKLNFTQITAYIKLYLIQINHICIKYNFIYVRIYALKEVLSQLSKLNITPAYTLIIFYYTSLRISDDNEKILF